MPTNNIKYGPFFASMRAIQFYYHPEVIKGMIAEINRVDGFLCNLQIPIMIDLTSRLSGKLVEVGVWRGKTTVAILAGRTARLSVDCVDTFMGSEEHQDTLKGASTRGDFEKTLSDRNMLNDVTVLQMTSEEASKTYADNSLDAVFIDAAHDYANVKLDILSWYPKLKSGGIMMGHDYPNPDDPNGGFEDLKRAVNELVRDDKDKFEDFSFVAGLWGAYKK
jgi:hypothetical protein